MNMSGSDGDRMIEEGTFQRKGNMLIMIKPLQVQRYTSKGDIDSNMKWERGIIAQIYISVWTVHTVPKSLLPDMHKSLQFICRKNTWKF